MQRDDDSNLDRWLWRMNRHMAAFIHDPSAANERRLRRLIKTYRSRPACPQTVGRCNRPS